MVESCLNPFGAGQGLSTVNSTESLIQGAGLNPFGTGRGLSTQESTDNQITVNVSIPLEQGRVFRQIQKMTKQTIKFGFNPFGAGRSLST